MTLAAFFVSAFITVKAATGLSPLQGWTQFIMPYETKEECEHFVHSNTLPLMMQLQANMGKYIEEFHEFQCLTEKEAIDKNVELGHQPPEEPDKKI